MVSATEDYQKRYGEAQAAYLEEDYDQATIIADSMAEDYPDDPMVLLLQGHILLNQKQFDLAKEKYYTVMEMSDPQESNHEDVINAAHQGLERIGIEEDQYSQLQNIEEMSEEDYDYDFSEDNSTNIIEVDDEDDDWTNSIQFENLDWNPDELEDEDLEDPTLQHNAPSTYNSQNFEQSSSSQGEPIQSLQDANYGNPKSSQNVDEMTDEVSEETFSWHQEELLEEDSPEPELDIDIDLNLEEEEIDFENLTNTFQNDLNLDDDEDEVSPTFVVSPIPDSGQLELNELEKMLTNSGEEVLPNLDEEDDDDSDFSSEIQSRDSSGSLNTKEKVEESFFDSDELNDIPDVDPNQLPVSNIFRREKKDNADNALLKSKSDGLALEDESFISGKYDSSSTASIKPEVEVSSGKLTPFFDAPLRKKQFISAGVIGFITFICVFVLSSFVVQKAENENNSVSWTQKALLSLIAGVTSGGATLGVGQLLVNHVKRYQNDLQSQFDYISQGNFNVKATIYSEDELGQLATNFNQMTKVINTTTTEARRRAEETERATEELQRQVIRLLDDVEGASRGDLTVQAEVTAGVLGAVADAFNLTITSLREIIGQVKNAALQVNKSSTDSELYARNQSRDALQMAEELAVTLNSVQMMTDSIQRVADNAIEAEKVARTSIVTALKGGDAVERTVAGIIQIRDTVSETTRKVKRLAEASQEISTIVAVISQISSRTNLLALNASIQAARAGEAGRGFAIVADEVRQLADRSAKSLQEIEQIVLKIQTETGSVMTAMEEGIQQVIDVNERSEQAKGALDDIIQVSNRIDNLVRSITADTDEQRENSRAVAKVMQAVELRAQSTSQESQRVATALQNLVSISKDLLSSVERFQVEDKK